MGLKVRQDSIWVDVGGGGGGPEPGDGWQRPSDWLPLPTLTGSDRQFSALVAVLPFESSYLSLSFQGAYQVDWGDGSALETFASNAQAHHIYDYSALDAGTLTSRGYRQAVVTVTPTTGTWSTINLNVKNAALANGSSSPLLDIVVAGSTLSTVTLRGTTTQSYLLEQFTQVGTWSVENFSNMFNTCSSLQSVPALDTSSGTNFSSMFSNCYSLQSVPALDTSSGTNFSNMFYNCPSLKSVPALDTSSGTNFSSMFSICYSLADAPLSGTAQAISYATTHLSRQAIVRIFNGLATAAGAQTITITNTPGRTALTAPERAIATDKGWTISG